MKRNHPSAHRQRGAATLEAIMVMTLMILLWAGISHLGSVYTLSISAKSQARGCAWRVSASSCEKIPDECEVTLGRGKPHEGEDKLKDQADEATDEGIVAKICRVALLDQITSLFSKRARASAGTDIKEPPLLGGKDVRVAGHYSLPCNSRGGSAKDQESDMKDNAISNVISGNK